MAERAGAVIEIDFEGERLPAVPGETIAATLLAHGRLSQSTAKDGSPRGFYCGMGVCHDCLVEVDGCLSQRSCLVKAEDGMRVRRHADWRVNLDAGPADLAHPPEAALPSRNIDILIVGAGPGGLAAAQACRQAGASALIVDERPGPGGQYYKQPLAKAAFDRQAAEGRELIAEVGRLGVHVENDTLVWGAFRDATGGLEIATYSRGRARIIKPRILIVATGAYERPIVVPGWTLPGVMTSGAAQTFLRSYGIAPGRRVLVAGNGPLNFQVAAELLDAGASVIVVEASPSPWRRLRHGLALASADPALAFRGMMFIGRLLRRGAPIYWNHRLMAVEGCDRAQRAVIAPLGAEGMRQEAAHSSIEVDAVCTNDGFWPAAELPRLLGCRHRPVTSGSPHLEVERGEDGGTSLVDVFVVGEAGGFGGACVALAQGELAGLEAARRLGFRAPAGGSAQRRLKRQQRFQTALWRLFAAPDAGLSLATDSTPICRCEAVSLGALRRAITPHAAADVAALKRLTRAGMGRCQGRYCAPRLHELLGESAAADERAFLAPQMPLKPVPLAVLSIERPEWGGHKRVALPVADPRMAEPRVLGEAATLVVGAGIVGVSTALFLARAGHDVALIDSGLPNAGASGANAGSLHAQLLSFDHGAKAEAAGAPALRTLPLQVESIRLWQSLERELGADFEINITGGLMVAENAAEMAFLASKTAAEQRQGIDCAVIGADELRALEPALSDHFIGAAFCPLEGKINPLIATQGLLDAALAAGARLLTNATVIAIARQGAHFHVATSGGLFKAGRVVNAAGAFASRIGAMLGADVPVHGAPLQMAVTEAAQPLISRLLAHADRHLTLKQAANGNFIIGGGWTAALDPVHQRPRPIRPSMEGNLWVAQHVVPALRKLHLIRTWAAMNINIDGAPILGEHPAAPGLFNAVTSNGYTLGPLMGLTTAELILHGRAERDIAFCSIERFHG